MTTKDFGATNPLQIIYKSLALLTYDYAFCIVQPRDIQHEITIDTLIVDLLLMAHTECHYDSQHY
jgi:hypothetical protein